MLLGWRGCRILCPDRLQRLVTFFPPFFFPSISGREKKKKGEGWFQTSACFWAEKAGFVVNIISRTIFSFEGVEGDSEFPTPLPSSTSCEQRKSILLICRGVEIYSAPRLWH